MAEVKDADAGKSSLKDKSFQVTDSVSRLVRAATGAATEAAVGTVKVGTTFVSELAQNTADTITSTVEESTKVARAAVDRFFTTLDPESESAERAAPAPARDARKPTA
jgi:hypothetical protein